MELSWISRCTSERGDSHCATQGHDQGSQRDVSFTQYWKLRLWQSIKMALKALVGQSKFLYYSFICRVPLEFLCMVVVT
jgi:hypothetical protein